MAKSLLTTGSCKWWLTAYLGKPPVTGSFLTCPERDSNPGSGERQRLVRSVSTPNKVTKKRQGELV